MSDAAPAAGALTGKVGGTAGDERKGLLTGDRACIACGFNLSGQTIVRERHYGMLMVRCPECGTAASLQEYPILGPWAARLGAAVAGVWALMMLLGVVITALALWGFTETTASALSSEYGRLVSAAAQEHSQQKAKNAAGGAATAANVYAYNSFDEDWWAAQPPEKFFADAGGWAGAVHWHGLWNLLPAALVMGVFGVFWSVALCHGRWKTVVALPVIVMALAAAFIAIDQVDTGSAWFWMSGYVVAQRTIGLPLMPIPVAVGGLALAAGMVVGRRVVRALVVVFLPPRLRAPLSFLWIVDGRALPRGEGGAQHTAKSTQHTA